MKRLVPTALCTHHTSSYVPASASAALAPLFANVTLSSSQDKEASSYTVPETWAYIFNEPTRVLTQATALC
jgi:hypothetical protein